jgi:hypothetical protein
MTKVYAIQTPNFTNSAYTELLNFASGSKIWICTALGAYWFIVRVLRYRRRDGFTRRLNVRTILPVLVTSVF